jgi:ABC-2 type transport system permease protein
MTTRGGRLATDLEQSLTGEAMVPAASDAWYPTRQRDAFIIRQLVTRDFKLKYRRSTLGVAWSVLNPLLMMAVMAAVFSQFMAQRDPSIGNYPLYLILGNTAFSLMNDATSQGMRSIIDASSLLKKVKIDQFVFPLQKVLFSVVNYGFSLVAVFCVMLFFRVGFTPYALLLPVGVLLLALFCFGLSLFLSAVSVFFRDVMHLWSVVLTAWTYATPLFYPVSILPEWMLALEPFNPMYCYVTFIRDVLLWQQMPSTQIWLGCIASAVLALLVGGIVFKRLKHRFILFI